MTCACGADFLGRNGAVQCRSCASKAVWRTATDRRTQMIDTCRTGRVEVRLARRVALIKRLLLEAQLDLALTPAQLVVVAKVVGRACRLAERAAMRRAGRQPMRPEPLQDSQGATSSPKVQSDVSSVPRPVQVRQGVPRGTSANSPTAPNATQMVNSMPLVSHGTA